jgi:5'(3')-deoxyribonucleotidase
MAHVEGWIKVFFKVFLTRDNFILCHGKEIKNHQ